MKLFSFEYTEGITVLIEGRHVYIYKTRTKYLVYSRLPFRAPFHMEKECID